MKELRGMISKFGRTCRVVIGTNGRTLMFGVHLRWRERPNVCVAFTTCTNSLTKQQFKRAATFCDLHHTGYQWPENKFFLTRKLVLHKPSRHLILQPSSCWKIWTGYRPAHCPTWLSEHYVVFCHSSFQGDGCRFICSARWILVFMGHSPSTTSTGQTRNKNLDYRSWTALEMVQSDYVPQVA